MRNTQKLEDNIGKYIHIESENITVNPIKIDNELIEDLKKYGRHVIYEDSYMDKDCDIEVFLALNGDEVEYHYQEIETRIEKTACSIK